VISSEDYGKNLKLEVNFTVVQEENKMKFVIEGALDGTSIINEGALDETAFVEFKYSNKAFEIVTGRLGEPPFIFSVLN
jgi:hypothetical protein